MSSDVVTLPIEDGSLKSITRGSVECNGFESSLEDCDEDWIDNFACRIEGYEYAGVRCFTGLYVM